MLCACFAECALCYGSSVFLRIVMHSAALYSLPFIEGPSRILKVPLPHAKESFTFLASGYQGFTASCVEATRSPTRHLVAQVWHKYPGWTVTYDAIAELAGVMTTKPFGVTLTSSARTNGTCRQRCALMLHCLSIFLIFLVSILLCLTRRSKYASF